jgi:hypothetical protein
MLAFSCAHPLHVTPGPTHRARHDFDMPHSQLPLLIHFLWAATFLQPLTHPPTSCSGSPRCSAQHRVTGMGPGRRTQRRSCRRPTAECVATCGTASIPGAAATTCSRRHRAASHPKVRHALLSSSWQYRLLQGSVHTVCILLLQYSVSTPHQHRLPANCLWVI